MNLQRNSRILATGAVALALIGAGVAASTTDHWAGTQTANVNVAPPPPPVLTITSNSEGAVVNTAAYTVTFADAAITTASSDPTMGGIYDQFNISSTGSGPVTVSASISGTIPTSELAKFTLDNNGVVTQLGATAVVVANQTSAAESWGFMVNWTGLTLGTSGTVTVTYSIDAA